MQKYVPLVDVINWEDKELRRERRDGGEGEERGLRKRGLRKEAERERGKRELS